MTCIVALKEKDKIFLGCDGLTAEGQFVYNPSESKIQKLADNMYIGVSGRSLTANIIQANKDKLISEEKLFDNDFSFLFNSFRKKLLEILLSDNIHKQIEKNNDSFGSNILIVYNKNIYTMSNDSTIQLIDTYYAEGSGQSYAMGSLFTTKNIDIGSREKVSLALLAAHAHNCYVDDNIHIVEIK